MSVRVIHRIFIVLSALCLIGILTLGVFAQEDDRSLVPGVSVDSAIADDQRAQIFTYEGTEGDVIKLTVISGDGMALGILVSDSVGQPIAQGFDDPGNGFLVVDNVSIPNDGTYYITVFPLAVEAAATEGEFSVSLALGSSSVSEGTPDESSPTLAPTQETDIPVVTEEVATEAVEATIEPTIIASDTGEAAQILTTSGIQIDLTWNATVDFNIEVRDPVGGSVFWDSPTTESGGQFDGFNVNGACETFTADSPTESVVWSPGAVPAGSYEILVFYVQDCESNGAVPFTVDVTVDGQVLSPINGTALPGQIFISRFEVDPSGSAEVNLGGIYQSALPATSGEILAGAETISTDAEVTGTVTNAQPYQAFSFEASSGDVISASMEATSGSLDTYLYLIDEAGIIVASNDDANAETRNSVINSQLINTPGTYTLVATRYGQRIGGTEGTFTLSLSGAVVTDNLAETLTGIDVPDGIIEVSLVWETGADLQLLVRDPAGDVVFDDSPVIVSGGRLAANGNVNCTPADGTPVSYIYWPEGQRVRPGTYEIDVWFQNACGDTTPVSATLSVIIAGEVVVSDNFTPLQDEHYITTFTIGVDGTVVRGPGGISGGSETIDYISELATAPTLTSNVPVTGTISDDNRFDVYTFDGEANEVISLRMDASAGTLDTLLFLVGPTGVELVSNDDAVPNETTNSLISEFTLPQTGQYVVLATHYGTIYGGTNGVYTLSFSRLN